MNIKSINGVNFTSREIDVIACITNVKGIKKISSILDISIRTVETHVKNIFSKIPCNSQEYVRAFVEKSNEITSIRNHYLDLIASYYLKATAI